MIWFAPGGNFDVVYFADPEVSFTVARTVVPFRNLILPVGVPANDETDAVRVTGFPDTEGLVDESSAVVAVVLRSTPTVPLLQLLPVAHMLATSMSGLPSPLTSATANEAVVFPPGPYDIAGWNVPSPLPNRTPTVPFDWHLSSEHWLLTTRSGLLSPFTSATATALVANPPEP
jgi:hypothetical protein